MSYDDDKYGQTQTLIRHIPANNNSGNEVQARIRFFKNVKLLNVRCIPVSTAYDATDTFNILNDATAIGAVNAGAATGTYADIETMSTGTLINATSSLEIQQGTAAAAGSCHMMISYQEMFE